MSLYDYKMSQQIAAHDFPFYALIMAAMRQADTNNQLKLQLQWPGLWDELKQRYNAPGGYIDGDKEITDELERRPSV